MKQLIKTKSYEFLRTNEHLGSNIILLTLGGSHAYGTNNENSDVDIRGIALERPSDLIGFTEFEQVVETKTDTTIYGFNKIIKLLLNCNPNTIEMLGCKPEHYLKTTEIGQQLIDNRHMFLSQKAGYSFGGYANSQLNRLSNAIARDRLSQIEKENHIIKSLENALIHFSNNYTKFGENSIKLSIGDTLKPDLEQEILVDIHLENYSLRDLSGIQGEMSNIIKQYDKINHRNKKKDEDHLAKHMMHLVRLYLMAIDILEKEEIVTYRGDDLDLLMPIREGQYLTEESKLIPEFDELLNEIQDRFTYAQRNTSLPVEPDRKKIEEFVMEVNKGIINKKTYPQG